MQIAGPGVEAVMARVVEVSTSPSPPGEAGEAGQVASLEALCDLWRESRGDQVPHICATLTNAVIHLDTGQCSCSVHHKNCDSGPSCHTSYNDIRPVLCPWQRAANYTLLLLLNRLWWGWGLVTGRGSAPVMMTHSILLDN